jgi:hypothetical protein
MLSVVAFSKWHPAVWGNLSGAVVLTTRLRCERSGARIPQAESIFSSPIRPDRLRAPPCLLFHGYRGSFPVVKRPGRENHWPLDSAYPPYMPSCRGQGKRQVTQASVLVKVVKHVSFQPRKPTCWHADEPVSSLAFIKVCALVLKPLCLGCTGEVGSC